jgi:hypothetical protein
VSERPSHPQDSPPPPYGPVGGPPPVTRLPGWVNVVLVLILLASCSGANSRGDTVDTSQIADEVVQQLQGEVTTGDNPGAIATREDVRQLCELLARVAAKQGVDVNGVGTEGTPSACQDGMDGTTP